MKTLELKRSQREVEAGYKVVGIKFWRCPGEAGVERAV